MGCALQMEVGAVSVSAISTDRLTKHYGSTVALEDVTLEVGVGEIFGFLGPNGSGKTTTIRLLLALARPTRGSAEILGIAVSDVARAHRQIGYVAGDVALWPQLTGTQTLDLLGNVAGAVDERYRAELCERLNFDPSRRVRTYSKGTRQKLALVAAFMSRPAVLLLDEPTAGLDPLMEQQFQLMVREATQRGQTVFLSSHILDEVQDLCDRVGILRSGHLVEVATLAELRQMGTTIVEIVFAGAVPNLAHVPGVTRIDALPGIDGGVRVAVSGAIQPLISVLADASVGRLRTIEPSLEDVFLTYY